MKCPKIGNRPIGVRLAIGRRDYTHHGLIQLLDSVWPESAPLALRWQQPAGAPRYHSPRPSNGCGGCDRWGSRDGQIPVSTSVFSSAFPRSPFPIYYADGSVREPHSNIHQLRTKMPHRSNWALAKPATHSWQWWGSVGNISTCKYQRNSKLRHAVSVNIYIIYIYIFTESLCPRRCLHGLNYCSGGVQRILSH